MAKWVWNIGDHEIWNQRLDTYATPEEAVEAAVEARGVEYGEETDDIYVAEQIDYTPSIDAERVMEADREYAWDECGEVSETYLEQVTSDQIEELEKDLNKVYIAWLKKHYHMPNFYMLRNVRRVGDRDGK